MTEKLGINAVYNVFFVGMGGFFGANLRYLITLGSRFFFGAQFPFGTWVVNMIGSFALGYFHALFMQKYNFPMQFQLFITTGFLGALTTFSTFNLESYLFIQNGEIKKAMINIFGSILLGIAAVIAGYMLASRQ